MHVRVIRSANSWNLNELINNHGGLYNRVTYEIKLSPFTLRECEEFYQENNVSFSRYDIVQSYMIFGGIPYYMGYMDGRLSLAQNVDNMFFSGESKLQNEFDRLFDSAFVNPEAVKSIVRFLYTKNAGDFVIRYVPFGLGKREEHYKLVDPFCLFYLHFVDGWDKGNEEFRQQNIVSQPIVIWRGIAFENVCFNHVSQIKKL